MTAQDPLLLLYSDPADPVTRILLDAPRALDRDVVALSLDALVNEVELGALWRWRGLTIDPARTVVVNRLVPHAGGVRVERQVWRWLATTLPRFAYASALPTATALHGDFGTLLDQWMDLPALVPQLRVPEFRPPWDARPLAGDVHRTDPRELYSFGKPVGVEPEPGATLVYARPRGRLLHVAQVGGLALFTNVPPETTRADQSVIVGFVNTLAERSDIRILEHAFFVGDGPPVFFSTCPVPVITGAVPEFRELLHRGLQDDLQRRRLRAAA
jgi:hypothetical protein